MVVFDVKGKYGCLMFGHFVVMLNYRLLSVNRGCDVTEKVRHVLLAVIGEGE